MGTKEAEVAEEEVEVAEAEEAADVVEDLPAEDTDEEMVDVTELFDAVDDLEKRVESMDQALANSLRGIVVMFRAVTTLTDPLVDTAQGAEAHKQLREMLVALERILPPKN